MSPLIAEKFLQFGAEEALRGILREAGSLF